MGRQLDAHRQRFIEQGNLVAFLAGYDEALHADALASKETGLMFQGMAFALAYLPDYQERLQAERERALTPEELLAALEPTKAAPTLELSPSQQLRASKNILVDWWNWCFWHLPAPVLALAFVSALVLFAVGIAEILIATLHL